jgi:hypothetical protein
MKDLPILPETLQQWGGKSIIQQDIYNTINILRADGKEKYATFKTAFEKHYGISASRLHASQELKRDTASTSQAQASEEGVHASQEQKRDMKSNNNATSSTSRAHTSEQEKESDEHNAGSSSRTEFILYNLKSNKYKQ